MQVIDNVFSPSVFQKIYDEVMSFSFQWHYGRKVDEIDGSNENPYLVSFAHTVGHVSSGELYPPELYHTIETAFLGAMDDIGETVAEMGRIRMIMNTKADDHYVTMPHVDFDTPHQTALLYVNDCDGPSIIYDQKFNPILGRNSFENYQAIKDKMTVMQAVDPKANRMVLFNGLHYHSGTTPKDSARRVVININYKKK